MKDVINSEFSAKDGSGNGGTAHLPNRPAAAQPQSNQKARVLVVDDHEDTRESVRRLLGGEYDVIDIADGRKALEIAIEKQPDVILTDIMMPDFDGIVLINSLRKDERTAWMPIIVLSARSSDDAQIEGLDAGADDYLVKPFSARELMARIRAHLKTSRIRREALAREQALRHEAEQLNETLRRREQDLHRTNKELSAFVETAAVGLHWVGPDGKILWANEADMKLLGYSREEYVGHHIAEFHDDPKVIEDILARLNAGESLQQYAARLRCKDGSIRHVLIDSSVLWEDGKFIHTQCFTIDITHHKQAEQALRQSEERLRLATQTGKVGIWDWDIIANHVTWTDSLFTIHGVTPEQFKGTVEEFAALVHPDDRDRVSNAIRRTLETNVPYELEFRAVRPDGDIVWLFTSAMVIRDRHRPVRMLGATTDITASKGAEEALRQSQQRFARFMQNLPGLAWIKDLQGRYVFINDAAERAFGKPRSEIYGRTDEQIFPPETAALFRENDRKALTNELGVEVIETLRHSDGDHHSIVSKFPIPGSDGKPMLLGGMAIDITSRIQTEDALRDSERRYRQLVQGLPAAVYTCDARGKIKLYNQAAVELWGREPVIDQDEWCGSWKVYNVDGTPLILDQSPIAVVLREGRVISNYEIIIERPDGTKRHVLPHPQPIYDASGAIIGAVNMLVDITERKRHEEIRARLAAIVESSADVIISKSLEGVIASWNASAERLFGYSANEAVGRPITILIPLEQHEEERQLLQRLRKGERIEHFQTVRVAKDGRKIDVSMTISPIRDSGGRIIGASSIARDITEQKRITDAVKASEERLRVLAETVPSMVWTAGPDGKITWVNHRWVEYCGLHPEKNARDWPEQVIHPDDYQRCIKQWNKSLIDGTEYEIEVRNRRHDGTYRWFVTRAVPLRDASGQVISWFGVTTDIHDLKELQAALKESDRRKDEFLATLAHELRNPLVPIRNAIEIMRCGEDNIPLVQRGRGMIERQFKQIVRLVDDLLDISRISRGKIAIRKERITLEAVVESAIESSRPLLEAAGHELTISLPPEPIYLEADLTRVAQILMNLLNNAAKFTDPGGRIGLSAVVEGQQIIIRVQDTGIGIPADMLGHIFEMFAQVDQSLERSHGGLGIGLTLVQRLVEMHGGTVEAKSDGVGRGSEFIVRLPIATAPSRIDTGNDGEAAPLQSGRKVLIADDNRDAAESLALMLEITGNNVRTVHDGEEAVRTAEIFRPEVILLDIGMPGMNGYSAARHIRQQPWGKDVLLVALTGWGMEENRQRSHEAGFDHHVVKPAEPEMLEKLLASGKRSNQTQSAHKK